MRVRMAEILPRNKRLWIVLGIAGIICLLCLGLAVGSALRLSREQHQLSFLSEDNRTLREKIDRLGGQIERLKKDFDENSNQLKTKDELLTRADDLRHEILQQQQERLDQEKQRQDFLLSAREKVLKQMSADQGAVFLNDHELTIRLADKILFDPGQSDIMAAGQTILKNIADLLNNELKDYEIRVEGHTDNVPIGQVLKQRYPSNWELSAARASTAVVFLSEQGNVDPRRLMAVGRADTEPVAENDTPENKARNRRIDIVINLNNKDILPPPAQTPPAAVPKP